MQKESMAAEMCVFCNMILGACMNHFTSVLWRTTTWKV